MQAKYRQILTSSPGMRRARLPSTANPGIISLSKTRIRVDDAMAGCRWDES